MRVVRGTAIAGAAATGLASLALFAAPARAQVISPGKLSAAHADLEGMRSCTECHELGKPGADDARCLSCHTTLSRRVAAGRGLHARLKSQACAACHKEHFGRDFQLVRFEPRTFDHDRTGFRLSPSHAGAACRDCHAPATITSPDVRAWASRTGTLDSTWLGVETTCTGCHRDDSPHGDQFAGRACESCHGEDSWESAPGFDHDAARFVLTGLHRRVDCAGCHPSVAASAVSVVRWRPVEFGACATCHRDPHGGAMQGTCETCHDTNGWRRVDRKAVESRFDHDRTRFSLLGAHGRLSCEGCHAPGAERPAGIAIRYRGGTRTATYPRPVSEACASCHLDAHDGAFAGEGGGPDCESCHGNDEWTPSAYDLDRHARESRYALTGAHLVVACDGCHRNEALGQTTFTVRPDAADCRACHAADDPHGGQFEDRTCESCHGTASFTSVEFDHSTTRFALDGAHADVACASCHVETSTADGPPMVRYTGLGTACRDCHGGT
jgi:hypothetical protein